MPHSQQALKMFSHCKCSAFAIIDHLHSHHSIYRLTQVHFYLILKKNASTTVNIWRNDKKKKKIYINIIIFLLLDINGTIIIIQIILV